MKVPLPALFKTSPAVYTRLELVEPPFSGVLISRVPYHPQAVSQDSSARNGEAKNVARRKVRTFVQNIHHFVHDNLDRDESQPPYEHAIVFDEAQRAWNADQNHRKYRKRSSVWHVSEPEMVLRIMDRHSDWAVIIALVGGGQEIHQ